MESTEEWEATAAYISAPVMEGPTVIKLDGVYYLFYSPTTTGALTMP